ncbi:cellobiose phosphorylase [Bartonella doshiae]|uniref:Cellobiose phosphorylase n=2 Tax=Bartonella doshiae TaxID=33044 RepID=A0A380ZMI6_BARDO|nr:hypothetical protein MCS_00954 [Bartonella doshiae NCTC 12862 = ATCC 700133]MBB6158608.1 cellobiose phosphorylase [Bartonella doshiae]SUV46186.1 Cellobiose phosphorylase [Bartonella doshiae]
MVDGIKSTLECLITSEGCGEGRRIQLMNITNKDRLIEVTSYGELALATMDTDCAHPVSSRMFIETEITEERRTIFAKRRKRSPSDPEIHIAHFVTDTTGTLQEAEAETDRSLFIDRGRSIHRPAAFDQNARFSNSQGCVLDPIISLRCRKKSQHMKKQSLFFGLLLPIQKKHCTIILIIIDNLIYSSKNFQWRGHVHRSRCIKVASTLKKLLRIKNMQHPLSIPTEHGVFLPQY